MRTKVATIFVLCLVSLNAFYLHNEACDEVGEQISDPNNCDRFYECTTNGWVNIVCPSSLYFNPDTKTCDYQENVECDCPSNHKDIIGSSNCTENEYDRLYPDPTSCRRFIECSPLGFVSMPCPNDLYYNDEIKECDYSENVQCDESTKTDCTTTTEGSLIP